MNERLILLKRSDFSTKEMTEVYIAKTDFLADEKLYKRLYDAASPERKEKTDKLLFQKDKELSVLSERVLKKALKNIGVSEFSLVYGEHGKPYLRGNNNVFFNMSHSENTVMCAVSDSEVGCDVERVSEFDMQIARCFFAYSEYKMLQNAPEAERRDLFYRLWTLKESFQKSIGLGMSLPLDSFSVDLTDVITVEQNVCEFRFYFREYNLNDGFRYSVCARSAEFSEKPIILLPK